MNRIEFTCPKCGNHTLEEVMVGTVASTDIHVIECGGDIFLDYVSEPTLDGGEVSRYQCGECGWVIKVGNVPVTDKAMLAAAIRSHNE